MKKLFVTISLMIFFNCILFAGGNPDQVNEYGDLNSERRLLIATENTNFKDSLVRKLVMDLNDGNTYIRVIYHNSIDINTEDPRNYKAFLIINSGQQAIVRPWITKYLNSIKAYDDNVILVTTKITNWTPDVEVDSITTASNTSLIDDLVAELESKINILLE